MWRIWWASNNASKWQMGFNSAFIGLMIYPDDTILPSICFYQSLAGENIEYVESRIWTYSTSVNYNVMSQRARLIEWTIMDLIIHGYQQHREHLRAHIAASFCNTTRVRCRADNFMILGYNVTTFRVVQHSRKLLHFLTPSGWHNGFNVLRISNSHFCRTGKKALRCY